MQVPVGCFSAFYGIDHWTGEKSCCRSMAKKKERLQWRKTLQSVIGIVTIPALGADKGGGDL